RKSIYQWSVSLARASARACTPSLTVGLPTPCVLKSKRVRNSCSHPPSAKVYWFYFPGEAALAGEVVAFAGDVFAAAAGLELLAGFTASDEAGRKPRLLGLFKIFAAKLFTTFASDNATSINAALRMSFR